MRSINVYCCDWCDERFDSIYACEAHEDNSHPINERLKMVKGSSICPKCKGNKIININHSGWKADYTKCPTCDGKGIVIVKKVPRIYTISSEDILKNISTKKTQKSSKKS